jgi:hypothetical protein
MKERPILFSGPMVQAILDGRKTQTRRVIKMQPPRGYEIAPYCTGSPDKGWSHYFRRAGVWNSYERFWSPYGITGDRLWVRETFKITRLAEANGETLDSTFPNICYRADSGTALYIDKKVWDHVTPNDGKFKPSIFMPRWASRINLEITKVRVEHLDDISESDAEAEGVRIPVTPDGHWAQCISRKYVPKTPTFREHFRMLWEEINGKTYPWGSNPWVWVIEFKRI